MTVLLGPANADHFRVKVGRYGDRFYTDPLPTDDIAEASDWVGPSVSATKPPFANKFVPMRAIAEMPSEDWTRLASKDADERYEAIKSHDKLASRTNMDRGSIVHLWAEDRLFGRPIERKLIKGSRAAIEQAERFLPALESFFDTYQPELVAAEIVCLHRTLNTVGYGGTMDALIKLESGLWAVDWKSRNSDHAAYGDEAGQGGAYIGAEYMIVRGPDGNPVRTKMPEVAGVLIVSIREDGFRVYPIDAQGAIAHYQAMHAWWCAQQDLTHNKVIGRPWAPKNASARLAKGTDEAGEVTGGASPVSTFEAGTSPADFADRKQTLRSRYDLLNDEQKADYTARKQWIDTNDLDAVERLLDEVEPFNHEISAPEPVLQAVQASVRNQPPDEGPPVDDSTIAALQREFERLSDEAKFWIASLTAQGRRAGVDWRPNARPSVRRYELARGIVKLATYAHADSGFDPIDALLDIVRGLLGAATGREEVEQESLLLGAALGTLDHVEAARFAALVDDYLSTGSAA